jgi:hypothetical protein
LVIFKAEIRKALAIHVVYVTMDPDHAYTLHESITLHPSPRPCCTMPSRLAIINAVYAHYSVASRHHPAAAPKNDALRENNAKKSVAIVRSTYPEGFPRSSTSK